MNYTENDLKKIREFLEDDAFKATLCAAETPDAIKTLFAEKGMSVDDELTQAAFDKIEYLKNGGELSEEDLELVAGGGWDTIIACAGAGALIGAPGGPAGALVGGSIGALAGVGISIINEIPPGVSLIRKNTSVLRVRSRKKK